MKGKWLNPLYAQLSKGYRIKSLVQELPFRELENGLVFHHAGSLELGFEIEPSGELSLGLEGFEERWEHYRSLVRMSLPVRERGRFILELGPESPETLQRYRDLHPVTNPQLAAVLEGRAELLEQLRLEGKLRHWRCYFTCTLGFGKTGSRLAYTPRELREVTDKALALRERLFGLLQTAKLSPRVLEDQETFDLIWRYLNPGRFSSTPPRFLPREERGDFPSRSELESGTDFPTFRRQVAMSGIDNTNPRYLAVGERLVSTLCVHGMPRANHAGMLKHLMQALVESEQSGYIVLDLLHESFFKTLSDLHQKEGRFNSMRDGKGLARDVSVEHKREQIEHTIRHLEETGDHTYRMGLGVVLVAREKERLEAAKERLYSAFSHYPGSIPASSGYQNPFVFFSLLPFSGRINDFLSKGVESDVVSLAPYTTPWRGSLTPYLLLTNRWGSLTALDGFDPALQNYNGAILAGSGGGKTYLAQVLAAHDLGRGAEVMVVEHGENYRSFTHHFGGAYVPMQVEGESYNPFDLEDGQTEPDAEKKQFLLAWLAAILPPFPDPSTEALKQAVLYEAIERTYLGAVKKRRIEGVVQQEWQGCKLSHLKEHLSVMREIAGQPMSPDEVRIAHTLTTQLHPWTGETPFGKLFDRKTTLQVDSPLIYYSTLGLDKSAELRVAGTLYIQEQMWRRAKRQRHRFKRILADEVWAALQHPMTRDLIVGFFRQGRTFNTGTVAINNSVSDLRIPGLLESVSLLMLGKTEGAKALYSGIFEDLRPETLEQVARLKGEDGKYREYVLWARYGGGSKGEIVRLDAVSEEYWVYTTKAHEMAKRDQLIAQHGYQGAMRKLAGGVR